MTLGMKHQSHNTKQKTKQTTKNPNPGRTQFLRYIKAPKNHKKSGLQASHIPQGTVRIQIPDTDLWERVWAGEQGKQAQLPREEGSFHLPMACPLSPLPFSAQVRLLFRHHLSHHSGVRLWSPIPCLEAWVSFVRGLSKSSSLDSISTSLPLA